MAANKFRRGRELEKVRAEIADLHFQGLPQHEIANRVGLRQQTVLYHLQVLTERWREAAVASIEAHRARLLASSENRKRVLWAAYQASGGEKRVTMTRQRKLPAMAV